LVWTLPSGVIAYGGLFGDITIVEPGEVVTSSGIDRRSPNGAKGHLPRGRRLVATAVAPHIAVEDVAPPRAFRVVPFSDVSACNRVQLQKQRRLAVAATGCMLD